MANTVEDQVRENPIEVYVIGDDCRRLAPKFEINARNPAAADLHDSPSGCRASRKGHLVNILVAHQMFPYLTPRGQDAYNTCGQASNGEYLSEHH